MIIAVSWNKLKLVRRTVRFGIVDHTETNSVQTVPLYLSFLTEEVVLQI